MKINEIEKNLGIPKATIRFYEKEGLISPQRNENSYREYSGEDVELMKKIIIFRKIGIPVEDIRAVLNDEVSLQDMLLKNMFSLHRQMEELKGAMKLCMTIQENEVENKSFDTDYYWDMVHREEQTGNKFFAIMNDVIDFEKQVIGDRFDLLDENVKMKYSLSDSIMIAGVICTICGLLWSAMHGMSGATFMQGVLYPFILIAIYSVVGLPAFFMKNKDMQTPRYVRKICRTVFVVACTIIVLAKLMS